MYKYMYHVFCIIHKVEYLLLCCTPTVFCQILAGEMKSTLKNRVYSSAYRKALNLALKNDDDEDLEGYRVFTSVLQGVYTCLAGCMLVLQGVCLAGCMSYMAPCQEDAKEAARTAGKEAVARMQQQQ